MPKKSKTDYYKMLPDNGKKYKKRKKRGCISKDNFNYLFAVVQGLKDNAQRDALINKITKTQLGSVRTVVNKFLNGKIKVNPKDMKKLERDKNLLYGLVRPEIPVDKKKEILKQKGGFLLAPLLASIAGPLVKPVVGGILKGILQ